MSHPMSYRLTVTPRSALFLGGYSAGTGASGGDTAHDRDGLLVPASAVKGALRESALRITQRVSTGHDAFVGLFGDEGTEQAGKLRVAPLRPTTDPYTKLDVRHHVALERTMRSASIGHLFAQRVIAPGQDLALAGRLDVLEPLSDAEADLLALAATLTDQVGAGRGRGLGQVEIRLEPIDSPASPDPAAEVDDLFRGPADEILDVVLLLDILEPLKLGQVKDLSNLEQSSEVIAGSMLRGAVAGAIYRRRDLSGDENQAIVDQVILGQGEPIPVHFGDGHPLGMVDGVPAAADVVPAPGTLQIPKAGGAPIDLAVDLCALACGVEPPRRDAGAMQQARGSWVLDSDSVAWRHERVPRRLLTRLARNPMTGRAADGQLYSLDVIDPSAPGNDGRLIYQVPVRGTRSQLVQVERALRAGLWVGGTRSRGFGRVALQALVPSPRTSVADRHRQWHRVVAARGVPTERAASTGTLLALGPVALHQPLLVERLHDLGLEIVGGRSRRRLIGGWNSKENLPRTARACFEPGSLWIVQSLDGGSALDALDRLERDGLGPGRPDGWGHLVACHRIHTDCSFPDDRPTRSHE